MGFFASLIIARVNHKDAEAVSKENRERQRLERMYGALIGADKYFFSLLAQLQLKILYDQKVVFETLEKPPLRILEILVDLYTPNLTNIHTALKKAAEDFGNECVQVTKKQWTSTSPENKKAEIDKLFALEEDVVNKIDLMKKLIPDLIKP